LNQVDVVQFNKDTYETKLGHVVTYDDYVEYLRRLDLVGRLDDAPFKIEKAKDGKVILKEINPIYK